jgi:hypothetical protein
MMRRTWTASLLLALVGAIVLPASAPARGDEESSRARASVSGSIDCVFCESYIRHAAALRLATREVGALPEGVVFHLWCDDPETVVELQQYAFEKQRLRSSYVDDPTALAVCTECSGLLNRLKGAVFEVANSVHGVFTLITSTDPEVVRVLHKVASEEMQLKKGVRGS